MEDAIENSVYILGTSLVREYLFKKGLNKTLRCMDVELPMQSQNINSRILAKELNIQSIIQKNKEKVNPYKTLLEVIIFELISSKVKEQSTHKVELLNSKTLPTGSGKEKNPMWPDVNTTFTRETIQELNLIPSKTLGFHMPGTFEMSKLLKIKYKHLWVEKIHNDGLADLDEFLTTLSTKGS